jgi:AraC-like DNA-binding protein
MSYEKKMEIVKLVINNYQFNYSGNDGFFSENIQLLRPVQSVVYIILQWRLLLKFKKDNKEDAFKEYTQATITWLKNFTVAVSFTILTFLIFVIGVIYSLYTKRNINDIVFYASIPVAISFFYLSSYLIINPNVLLGLPYVEISKTNKASIVMDTQKFNEEVGIIERYLIQEAPYFKQNYTISELSLELSIPLKSLSFILNNHFKKNFNDFINYYRVAYIVDRIKAGDLKNYTLYALASKAGFSNKTSFVNAFKKVHNCTPSQYLVENEAIN